MNNRYYLFTLLMLMLIFIMPCMAEEHRYTSKVLFSFDVGWEDHQLAVSAAGIDCFAEGPFNHYIDSDGNLFIMDVCVGKIKKFSSDGSLVFATGIFDNLQEMTIDSDNHIYVRWGSSANTISKIDPMGNCLTKRAPFYTIEKKWRNIFCDEPTQRTRNEGRIVQSRCKCIEIQ